MENLEEQSFRDEKESIKDKPETTERKPKIDLKNIDLGKLSEALKEYNKEFSLGAIMGKTMADAMIRMISEAGEQSIESDESKLDSVVKKQILWGKIEKNFKDMLSQIGLSLAPIEEKGATILSTESGISDIHYSEMRVDVEHPNLFINYLSSLDEDSLTRSQVDGLEEVAKSLCSQIKTDKKREYLFNIYGELDKIIDYYKKLGIGGPAEKLESYFNAAKGRYLEEYLEAEKLNLLTSEGFGPNHWHEDANVDYYERKWRESLDLLKVVSHNARAKEFAKELAEILRSSVQKAKADLENRKIYDDFRGEEFKMILSKVLEEIDVIESSISETPKGEIDEARREIDDLFKEEED